MWLLILKSPKDSEIIEIGAIRFRDGSPIDEFSTFVKPNREISARISKINGITNDMVQYMNSIDIVMPQFLEFVKDSVLVAHNLSFDEAFLLSYAKYGNKQSRDMYIASCKEGIATFR